ncbi:MAG TPA: helix-turn-helix domain-containing protein, partial [Flavobacteriales bacterium]|nr:helix-turn-helix domain-containing protein [Flavobacteriales bacterium]
IDPSVVSSDREVVAFTNRGFEQEPLPQQLKASQREYLKLLLASTFDFSDMLRKVEYTQKDHPETAQFEDESMKTALQVFREKLRSEEENTQKFRGQLMRLLHEDKRDELLVRIEKGGAYYGDLLQAQMKALFQHMAQAEMLSKTKEYTNALKEIDGMLMKKVATISKVGYLTTCISNGEEVKKRNEEEKGLAAKRAAMVGEARAWAEEHKPKASTKSGRKRKRDEPGYERAPRRTKAEVGKTYDVTYDLHKEGLTLEEIAAKRSMAKSTIEGHFARGIAEGEVDIAKLMLDSERDTIADWMRENPKEGLNGAAGHFQGRFSYGQLRIVQAWVKREAAEA